MKIRSLLLFALLILIVTCKKEQNALIEPGFQEYVDRFFAEAKDRGIDLKEHNLEVVFNEIDACGIGHKRFNNTNIRRVEINPACWVGQSENYKEYLIFHELGHAVLERSHTNSVLPNAMAKSIMCGGGTGFEECTRVNSFPVYSTTFTPKLRKFYVDELFDSSIPFPEWSKYKPRVNGRIIFQEDFEGESNWTFALNDSTKANTYTSGINYDESFNSTVATIYSSERREDNVFASWATSFLPMSVAEGSTIELGITIKTEEVVGNGIEVFLRTDSGNKDSFEVSGLTSIASIAGTDTRRYSIAIPYYPNKVFQVLVLLSVLPNTKGKVSIDNLELTVYE